MQAMRNQINELPENPRTSSPGFVIYVKNNIPIDICDTDDFLFLVISANVAYLLADAAEKGWTHGEPVVLDLKQDGTFNMTVHAARDTLLRLINELDAKTQQANIALNLSHLRLHVQVPESHAMAHQNYRT